MGPFAFSIALDHATPEAANLHLSREILETSSRVERSIVIMPSPVAPKERGLVDLRPQSSVDVRAMAGNAMFGALIVMVAHMPNPARHYLFEGPVRLNPAVVDYSLGGGLSFKF